MPRSALARERQWSSRLLPQPLKHQGRADGLLPGRRGEVAGAVVVGGGEVALVAVKLDATAPAGAEDAVAAVAPRTTLMLLQITPSGLVEPVARGLRSARVPVARHVCALFICFGRAALRAA